MSASPETDVLSIFVGFLVLVLVLTELHGLSTASAVFYLPVLILAGLLTFVSFVLGVVLGSIIGAAGAGLFGLVLLALVGFWVFKSLGGVTAQNYLVFAVLLVALLLVL